MGGRSSPGRSPLGAQLLRLVASREEIDYHELVSELAPYVHPGRAVRTHERILRLSRVDNEKKRLTNRKMKPRPPNPDAVRIGQATIARTIIWDFSSRGYITKDKEKNVVIPGPRWEEAVEGYRKAELKNNGKR